MTTAKNDRITISINTETMTLVRKVHEQLRPGVTEHSPARCIVFVLTSLLEQWDTAQEMFDEGAEPQPVALPDDIERSLRELTDPNIGLKVTVRHDRTTPKDTEGLVPWDYIVTGYSKLPFIEALLKDYTNEGERRLQTVRTVLSRIPEEHWESEQTRSVVERALAQAV
jgi:hypothetical protein